MIREITWAKSKFARSIFQSKVFKEIFVAVMNTWIMFQEWTSVNQEWIMDFLEMHFVVSIYQPLSSCNTTHKGYLYSTL